MEEIMNFATELSDAVERHVNYVNEANDEENKVEPWGLMISADDLKSIIHDAMNSYCKKK